MAIRSATIDDYPNFTRLFAVLDPRETPPPLEWWVQSHRDAFFVDLGESSVGYVYLFPYVDDGGRSDHGYVAHVAIEEASRRRGLGRAAMEEAARRFRAIGCSSWSLHVFADNAPARALYRTCGLLPVGAAAIVNLPWSALEDLPSTTSNVRIETLERQHDAEAERTFGAPRGTIARLRRIAGRTFCIARRDGEVLGLIGHDPARSQTTVFHVKDRTLARVLLEHLASARADDRPLIRISVEDDEATSAALLAAGGELHGRLIRMEGSLT